METSVAEAFGLPPLFDPTDILADHPRLVDCKMIDAQVAATMAPLKLDPDA